MKGKRYTTEDKIRILREADEGKAILEVCRDHNISEVTFHRWKQQLGQVEINDARRLRERERENSELKKMLAESLLKNRVLEAVCEKNCKPGASTAVSADHRVSGHLLRAACRILRLSRSTYWYRGRPLSPAQQQLGQRLRALSEQHPRYGYRRIAALLRQEGWRVGKRHVQRLRRAGGLRVPPPRRKLVRRGISTGLPVKAAHRGHVWT
jgi:putative transposase